MSVSLPDPSRRLLRAAAAEHADLTRHRERLTRERDSAFAELQRLDEAVAAIDRRLAVLGQLTGAHGGGDAARNIDEPGAGGSGSAAPHPSGPDEIREILRGPAVREVAVQVLIAQTEQIEALHYRRWYELVQAAGYAVAGKDPLAVFLTQVTRSPVVRKSSEPGVYEVDRQTPLRIRQRLERLQAELREVALSQAPIDLATVRARRHELDLAISRQERALEEALRVLRRDVANSPSTPNIPIAPTTAADAATTSNAPTAANASTAANAPTATNAPAASGAPTAPDASDVATAGGHALGA
jgi:hypothetical protein